MRVNVSEHTTKPLAAASYDGIKVKSHGKKPPDKSHRNINPQVKKSFRAVTTKAKCLPYKNPP